MSVIATPAKGGGSNPGRRGTAVDGFAALAMTTSARTMPLERVALILGSTSPRRRELLAQMGVEPVRIVAPDIDEAPLKAEHPRDYALRMATEKARVIAVGAGEVALTGDTVVAAGRRILPRAADAAEIIACLTLLSGRRHRVLTAVATVDAGGLIRTRLSESIVAFAPLDRATIAAYAAGGEGVGKAGGYAIQGRAGAFIRWMSGSYSGIVGLPLFETRALLIAAGLPIHHG
jgi:septum formation protein